MTDRILNALRAAGDSGLLIEELATGLGLEREIIIEELKWMMSEGLVMQKTELDETRFVVRESDSDEADHSSISDLNGCPCFHCLKIVRCGVRQLDSPVLCRELDEWMMSVEEA